MIHRLASQQQLTWRKSSYSGHQGSCVEVAAIPAELWRKSSRSGDTGGNCVEVAFPDRSVAARDSKDPEGWVLVFGHPAWSAFLAAAARGVFDLR
ncbi:DUF397 domain-containing protein [Saccharopolyspora hattusasensis]|uniref:DUF397 domain-containing protein n=1 Tax=Saccharopolyspora hattusasensis TaxID=1128679 RepID=UPI003D966610